MTRLVWFLFFTPPFLLLLGGVLMLALSPTAWGKAAHAGLADWMPFASALVFALPAIYIGGATCRRMLRLVNEALDAMSLQVWVSAGFIILAAASEFVLATRIGDPRTFDSLLDSNGNVNTSPEAFLAITLAVTAFMSAWVGSSAYMYTKGLNAAGARFVRRIDEPDYMDDFFHGRTQR
jgi:hypothetical protein